MEPWRRRSMDRYTRHEAREWKFLGVVCIFLGTYIAVQEGEWLALPVGILAGLLTARGTWFQRSARSASSATTFESWPPCQASGDAPSSSTRSSAPGMRSAYSSPTANG